MALPKGVLDERNTAPAKGGETVVADTPFTKVCRGIWVGGAGNMAVTFEDGTTATLSGVVALSSSAVTLTCAGTKSLSATLDRIRLTTTGGTNTFDAGNINIVYET